MENNAENKDSKNIGRLKKPWHKPKMLSGKEINQGPDNPWSGSAYS